MGLLAAEITATSGHDPSELYNSLTPELGGTFYERIDAPATHEQKALLAKLSPDKLGASKLAGDAIVSVLTKAPGNDQPFGGIKVISEGGWFAARPSGTEEVYKIYAESFRSLDHLHEIQAEAQKIISATFEKAGR
jgi:phosphoglucomutase